MNMKLDKEEKKDILNSLIRYHKHCMDEEIRALQILKRDTRVSRYLIKHRSMNPNIVELNRIIHLLQEMNWGEHYE